VRESDPRETLVALSLSPETHLASDPRLAATAEEVKGREDDTEHKPDEGEAEPEWPELHEDIERELKRLREQRLKHRHEVGKWDANGGEDSG